VSGDHHVRIGSRYRGRLTWVFALVLVFMVVEIIAGLLTGSLALLSDAGHMATDAIGLGMALAAIIAADRAGTGSGRTFGLYRTEILAALANALLLFAVALYVVWEAVRRFSEPPEILSGQMLAVGVTGLAVNIVGWLLLRDGAAESVNVEGAVLEVIADLVGSIGVVIAAGTIAVTGWTVVDPIVGAAIGLFILPRAWRLGRRAVRILIQAAPDGFDLDQMHADLLAIDGVAGVHDMHVWTLTSGMPVATVHLVAATGPGAILEQAQALLKDSYGLAHATLQVEPANRAACTELTW
jgi:cobalt-zinc-cadmium efflux system protein